MAIINRKRMENTISQLRNKVVELTNEINSLNQENQALKKEISKSRISSKIKASEKKIINE